MRHDPLRQSGPPRQPPPPVPPAPPPSCAPVLETVAELVAPVGVLLQLADAK
jgi:hypothetical protein